MDESRSSPLFEPFSQRELEILRLIQDGFTNGEIARSLYLSLDTVKWYNQQIFGKLGVNNRMRAVERAREIGLIHIPARELCTDSKLPAHNLPAAVNSLIGRVKAQKEILALLRSACSRLVTIYGPGGIGKTRLAIEIARKALPDFPNGVWLVDLSPVNAPNLVPQVAADVLGLHNDGKQTPEDALVRYLRSRKPLLIIDNCEHLAEACALLIALLLRSCPELRILATSREVLGVEGEALYPVLPLPFPDPHKEPDVKALKRYDAVKLFVQRAEAVQPGFTITQENARDIALVCQRLDGIPLALELAAARTNVLSMEQMAARMEDCIRLLSGKGHAILPRHKTMRAVMDWSYNLLSEEERVLLRRLAVFVGGWTLNAAEQVCLADTCSCEKAVDVLDLLSQLVDKSMVIVSIKAPNASEGKQKQKVRYRLLEPIRQYALAKLDQAGEVEALRDHHLAYFLSLAEGTQFKPFQKKWPDQWKLVKPDQDNLRSALGWALTGECSMRVEYGLQLVGALSDFWTQVGQNQEGLVWLTKALALADDRGTAYQPLKALFYQVSGHLAGLETNYLEAKRLLGESIALFRACGEDWQLAQALSDLALWSYPVDQEGAWQAINESVAIARRIGDPIILAISLFRKGDIHSKLGNTAAGILAGKESLKLLLDLGERGGACYPIALLAQCAIQQGDVTTAIRYRQDYLRYRSEAEDLSMDYYASGFLLHTSYYLGNIKEVETIAQNLLDQSIGQNQGAKDYALRNLGIVRKCQGDYKRAAASYYESICGAIEMNDSFGILACTSGLAGILVHMQQPYCAARLFGAVEELLKAIQRTLAWGPERGEFEKEVAALHAMVSVEDFSRAMTEGRSMTFEEVVQEARLILEELRVDSLWNPLPKA